MLEKFFDKILEEEEEKELAEGVKEKEEAKFPAKAFWLLIVFVFLLALVPRIAYIFIFSNPETPGWYTDTFHHWQIAYLSKEIGFSNGFLRLWDFKGMEYFWGLLHPLVLATLFTVTGSVSIIILRVLSSFGGSISIVLLFFLIRRYFNSKTAWAVSLFATFFPITLFSNTSGMQEELGMPLILTGLLLWPKKLVIIGILFALASMVRAEYWLFSLGLVFSAFFLSKKTLENASLVFISYLILIVLYVKYLAAWTGGNYIYPIYWNFLANARGAWAANVPIVGEKLLAKDISQGIFVVGVIGALITLIKRPKYLLLFLFGFGNIIFIGFMLGFTAYIKGYFGRFWLDRLYNWPYLFAAILILIFLFYGLPKKLPIINKLKLNWGFLLLGILVSQIIWRPIDFYMKSQNIQGINDGEKEIAGKIAKSYKGGVILMPEDRPAITYFLVHDFKIEGKNMIGQMFDPFFYFKDKSHPFSNWEENRKIVFNWLKKEKIRLIALTVNKETYMGLIEREPFLFKKIPAKDVLLYEVEVDKIGEYGGL